MEEDRTRIRHFGYGFFALFTIIGLGMIAIGETNTEKFKTYLLPGLLFIGLFGIGLIILGHSRIDTEEARRKLSIRYAGVIVIFLSWVGAWANAHLEPSSQLFPTSVAVVFAILTTIACVWVGRPSDEEKEAYRLARIEAAYRPDDIPPDDTRQRIFDQNHGTVPPNMVFIIVNGLHTSLQKFAPRLDSHGNPVAASIIKARDETVATALAMLHFLEPIVTGDDEGPFEIDLLDNIRNFGPVLQKFLDPLFQVTSPGLFDDIKNRYYANRYAVSTQLLSPEQLLQAETSDRGKWIDARDHPGTAQEIVKAYLVGTPFYRLFDA